MYWMIEQMDIIAYKTILNAGDGKRKTGIFLRKNEQAAKKDHLL